MHPENHPSFYVNAAKDVFYCHGCGGGAVRVSLDEALTPDAGRSAELVALDEALTVLAQLNERQSRVVELRFFGGLTEEEIGAVLQVSSRTVRSDWRVARLWLRRELSRAAPSDP